MRKRVSKLLNLTSKVCAHCNVEKNIDEFGTRKVVSGTVPLSYCYECKNLKARDRLKNNPEAVRTKQREYADKNRTKVNLYKQEWKERNKETVREYEKLRARHKRKTDPNYRLKQNLRARIWDMLRQKKCKKTFEYVGCSLDELKKHLEDQFTEGMTWDNYGQWHVDHIRPLASFDLTNNEEQKIAFHFTNLQPLWAKDNMEKSAKLNWEKRDNNA